MDKTLIDNNARQKKVNTDYHNFRHNLRHEEKKNKKITQAGGVGNQHLPLALSVFL